MGTDLWTLIDWFFRGFIRYVLFWIPLVTPFPVDWGMPWQWLLYNSVWDWFHHNDNNGGPDEHWLQCWFRMVFGEALRLAVWEARPYVDQVKDWLRDLIGYIGGGFSSLGSWVNHLDGLIGHYVPSWAGNIARGLNIVRDKLPAAIRYGWHSWSAIWDRIKSEVRGWARDRYDSWWGYIVRVWNWISEAGLTLQRWYDRAHGELDAFRSNPAGYIADKLGEAWVWLRNFRYRGRDQVLLWLGPDIGKILRFGRDCVTFYYNLWSLGWRELADLVSDPCGWLYDRLQSAIEDRW